jgi:hypothetical protein
MYTKMFSILILCLILNPIDNIAQVIESKSPPSEFHYDYNKISYTSNVPMNEISSRAFRHFLKNYSPANSEKWIKTSGGYVAVFIESSILYNIFYNKRGRFLYSYKYYSADSCTLEQKNIIQGLYPSFHITHVIELNNGNRVVYGVLITDGNTSKELEMNNGEIKIIDEFINQ